MKTVLIGLGDIGKHHNVGLRKSALFELAAVCDVNPEAPSRAIYADIPFYTDEEQMLAEVKPELAVLATPPSTHAAIARICAAHGVQTLVEKPLASNEKEVASLTELIRQGKLNIIYHWMFSPEILWFKRNIRTYNARKIHFRVEDPYTDESGHVVPTRCVLGGCWIDSGVNVLSVLSLWEDLSALTPVEIHHTRENGIPVETHAVFRSPKLEVEIDISWRTRRNFKETTFWIGDDTYVMHHSMQSVSKNGEMLFRDDSMDRLDRHYYNFYCLYPSSLISASTTEMIHNILFDNI